MKTPKERLIYDGLQRCPYLPGQVARMPLYLQMSRLDLDQMDLRFARAERRVGACLYHTACPSCRACEGLRIPVQDFRPSRTQRRVWRAGAQALEVRMGPVLVDEQRLALYRRHKLGRNLADEDAQDMTQAGMVGWLQESCGPHLEMSYYLRGELVGVSVVDVGREALSSVYFYFDPREEVSKLRLGTFSILRELELCRATGRRYLYLGLWVRDCSKLAYKADYRPHERLVAGVWRRQESVEEGTE
jgi:arginine-tRNA-protein transferase